MAKVTPKLWKPKGPRIVPLKERPEWRDDPQALTIYVGLNTRGTGPFIQNKTYQDGCKVDKAHPTFNLAYVARASGIEDVAATLAELAKYPAAIVLRGAVRAGSLGKDKLNRRWKNEDNPKGAPDLEHKMNHSMLADLDSVPAPTDFDWLADPARAAKFAIERYLPIPFHRAAFYCELSASAGIKAREWMNLHLWFWLSQPVSDDSLKDYFEKHNKAFNKGVDPIIDGEKKGAAMWPVDVRLFQPMQPHFSGYPHLINTPDPVPNRAVLAMDGRQPEVLLPMTVLGTAPTAASPASNPLIDMLLAEDIAKRNDARWICEYDGITLSIEQLRVMLPYAVLAYNKHPQKGRSLWWVMVAGIKHYLLTESLLCDEGDPSPASAFVDAEFNRKLDDFDESQDAHENRRQWSSMHVDRPELDQARIHRVFDMAERSGYQFPREVQQKQEANALEKAQEAAAKLTQASSSADIEQVLALVTFTNALDRDGVLKSIKNQTGKSMADIRDGFKDVSKQVSTGPAQEKTTASQAASLLLEVEGSELWNLDAQNHYISIPRNGHIEHHHLDSELLKNRMAAEFYEQHGAHIGPDAIEKVLMALRGKAEKTGKTYPAFVRVANAEDSIYLDLYNKDWSVVEITARGWNIVPPPIKMIRGSGDALAVPQRGGSMDDLKRFINFQSEDDFKLLAIFLIAAFRTGRPYVILILTGEKGSAKTTCLRVLKRLIDPSKAEARSLPKSEEDLMVLARGSYLVTADNLSGFTAEQADMYCRLATGGGLTKRKLFTDGDEYTMDALRPVIFTGINIPTNRQDLLDRTMIVRLDRLIKTDDEERFYQAFEEARPKLLGALCDAVSGALANLHKVNIELPRMADFARFGYAACLGLKWNADKFLESFNGMQRRAITDAGESHKLSQTIVEWFNGMVNIEGWYQAFHGTPLELWGLLEEYVKDKKKEDRDWGRNSDWPNGAQALTRRLNEQAAGLRALGVEYEHDRDTATRTIYLWKRDAYAGRPDFKDRKAMAKEWTERRASNLPEVPDEARKRKAKADARAQGSKDTGI